MRIKETIAKYIPKAGWQLIGKYQKNEPTILIVAAGVCVVGAVAACVPSTIKAVDIVEEAKEQLNKVHEATELAAKDEAIAEKYTEQDRSHDLVVIYSKTAVRLLKTYAPTIALTILGLYCMGRSHKILNARNAALTASVGALKKSYDAFYERTVDKLGKEKADELRYGLVDETEEVEKTDEKGKVKKVKEKFKKRTDEISPYAQHYGIGATTYRDNARLNRDFLEMLESILDDQLHRKGYLMLNEVYEQLGLPQKKKYVGIGWCLANPNCEGHVDLGFHDTSRLGTRAFLNGIEPGVWIIPNVDVESVYDHLGESW